MPERTIIRRVPRRPNTHNTNIPAVVPSDRPCKPCAPDCPSPEVMSRVAALQKYALALRDFRSRTLDEAAALDAMRREAVGHAPFDLVDLLPGGRKNCRQIAEKMLAGTELYTALQQALSECRDNLLPLLAVARALDSLEATHGAKLATIAEERLSVMNLLKKEARLD